MVRGAKPVCAGLLVGLLALLGCVRREMSIVTNPAGATVEMDGQLIATEREVIDREGEVIEIIRPVPKVTPIRMPFSWYGTHRFLVRKKGFVRAERVVDMRPPWYGQFPIDFFFDNVFPWTLQDIRTVAFDLEAEKSLKDATDAEKDALKKALAERAEAFRQLARDKVKPDIPPPPPPEKPAPEKPAPEKPAPEPEAELEKKK